MKKVLFVCLGNICRSPMAEAILRHMAKEKGISEKLQIDSRGTANYHIGEAPSSGTRRILDSKEISYKGILAGQITKEDIKFFDYIIAMDQKNLESLKQIAPPEDQKKLHMLCDFIENSTWNAVPDPWYTHDYEETYTLVYEGCQGLLMSLFPNEEQPC